MEFLETRGAPEVHDRQGGLAEREPVKGTGSVCSRGERGVAGAGRPPAASGSGPRPQPVAQLAELFEQRAALEGELQGSIVEAVQIGQEMVAMDVERQPVSRRNPRGAPLGESVVRVPHLPATMSHVRSPFSSP